MRWVRSLWLLGAVGWFALLASGWCALLRQEFTPGSAGEVISDWPTASTLPRDRAQPTLVLFAHRNCPCTRQTLGELEQILANVPGRVHAWVVLVAPEEGARDRVGEGLEALARSLPGVQVRLDPQGTEARRFHVRTSGHVLLYDAEGRLRYSGGITEGRGHGGDSVGRRAVLAWLEGRTAMPRTAPVFGCSLFDDEEEKESTAWDQ
jgi:hypothetical protein